MKFTAIHRQHSLSIAFAAVSIVAASAMAATSVKLPAPSTASRGSIEASLQARRSIRAFEPAPILLRDLGQLLWAAQGITSSDGHRTAPSAGATYPLEVYVLAMNVEGLSAGVYHYRPKAHELELVTAGDWRAQTVHAARGQQSIAQAPVVFVIAAVQSRTAGKYGVRADSYVAIEAGAAAENLALQAVALNLGTCFVGAFDDAAVRKLVALGATDTPIIVLPAGRPKR
jgi:SagB-type dehydrogenase family enzyme